MSTDAPAWELAKRLYLDALENDEERHLFETASPQSLVDDAAAVDKAHGRSRHRKLVTKIQPLVDALEDYGRAMDTIANIQPIFLGSIWGSIRVVLIVAAKYSKLYERVTETFGEIGEVLPRFEDYQHMFPAARYDRLNTAIAETYLDIINFCVEIRALLNRHSKLSSVKRLLTPVLPDQVSAITRFKTHAAKVKEEAQHCHLLEQNDARAIVLRDRQLQESRRKAGAGKSVLVSSVVDDFEGRLAYYYCDYADKRTLSAAAVFGTIAQQLLLTVEELPPQLETDINAGSQSIEILLSATNLGAMPTIIIDGIDELNDVEQRLLTAGLRRLTNVRLLLSCRNNVSTDYTFPLTYSMHVSGTEISIDIAAYIHAEVEQLIQSERLVLANPDLQELIISALTDGARGMFLWVYFQLQELCEAETDHMIIQALENLPKDLGETYSRLLGRIVGAERQDLVRRMFQWVLYSRRPLTLSELAEAIAFMPDDEFWDSTKIPTDIKRIIRHCNRLLVVDADKKVSLAHFTIEQFLLDKTNNTPYRFDQNEAQLLLADICMTYLSFSDFESQITQYDGAPATTMQTLASNPILLTNSKLASTLSLMRGSALPQTGIDFAKYLPARRAVTDLKSKYQLLDYVVENWLWHGAAYVSDSSESQNRRLTTFKLLLQKDFVFELRPWSSPDEDVAWALENSFPLLLESSFRDALALSNLRSTIAAAVCSILTASPRIHCESLLQHPDATKYMRRISTPEQGGLGWKPHPIHHRILVATVHQASQGHNPLAQVLEQSALSMKINQSLVTNVNVLEFLLRPILIMEAAEAGHLETVRALLPCGVTTLYHGPHKLNALERAALNGHLNVMLLLIAYKYRPLYLIGWGSLSSRSNEVSMGSFAMMKMKLAMEARRLDILTCLLVIIYLSHKYSVLTKDDSIPFYQLERIAVLLVEDKTAFPQLLYTVLDDDFNLGLSTIMQRFSSPAQAAARAARGGWLDVATWYFMILSPVKVSDRPFDSGDPSIEEVLERLLAAGMDPHQRDTKGKSPLCLAVELNMPQLLPVLFKAGVDPNGVDANRAFEIAVVRNNPAAVQQMLQAGYTQYRLAHLEMGMTNSSIDVVKILAEVVQDPAAFRYIDASF